MFTYIILLLLIPHVIFCYCYFYIYYSASATLLLPNRVSLDTLAAVALTFFTSKGDDSISAAGSSAGVSAVTVTEADIGPEDRLYHMLPVMKYFLISSTI